VPLKITPFNRFKLKQGSQVDFELDMVDHLDGDSVATATMLILDGDDEDVTSNFGGGCTESGGVVSFGIIGYATGWYTIKFTVTCNEVLPDGTTQRKFFAVMKVQVIS
jgi:hypothetical protein